MRVGEVYSVVALALAGNFHKILGVKEFMNIKKSGGWIVHNKSEANVRGSEIYAEFLKDESSAALCDDFVVLKPKFSASFYYPSAKDDLEKFYKSIKFTPKIGETDSLSNQLLLIATILKQDANANSQRLLSGFSVSFFLPYATQVATELQNRAMSKFYQAMGYFLADFCNALRTMIGDK
ncbi:hypothetical protein KDD93_00580 [Campylobacter sp. faydin G-24]|uniref:Uncharacterized protein n=1 Tax=Campylobacter anatolicus TaxID=2829105 RepID=A0ABS5HGD8_9BACT|nr:hypothetical protein [Campylobacter anatolicus]MBR8463070.1 hypothetical protein [Campylobacter anatolicus]